MRAVGVWALAMICAAGLAQGQTVFTVSLDGAQAGTGSSYTGSGTVTLNQAETQITVAFTHNIPNANVTMSHIHQGAIGVSGPIIFMFASNGTSPTNETFAISPSEVTTLKNGNYYVNVHTIAFGAGEIRGQVLPVVDSDGDGLSDAVETDTGTYVSPTNTGSDPNDSDSDDDGVNDFTEVSLSTDPNNALSVPNVPLKTPWMMIGVAAVIFAGTGFIMRRRKRSV